jgi:tRNA-dihydrouridine synthase
MHQLPPIPKGALFLAPMEGVTHEPYRRSVLELFSGWDYYATDFLRVPAAGRYPLKHLQKHFGLSYLTPELMGSTQFQILTAHDAFTLEIVKDLQSLKFPWLDLNLGCPSKTVCKNGGGSYLLKDLITLAPLVRTIRHEFTGRFSVKVRIGFSDGSDFCELIRMLNGEGVDLITVHARTREQMYKEPANWAFIEEAVNISKVPIIGNGDVWKMEDIDRLLMTGCHGVMMGRGALKAPWIAKAYKQNLKLTEEDVLSHIKLFIKHYTYHLLKRDITERGLLRQIKSISRYMFDDFKAGEEMRRKILLSQTRSDLDRALDFKTISETHLPSAQPYGLGLSAF